MVMLAAFHLLLHRYTNQDDILVGIPIAGRTQHELEGLIGFFVNSLVIRCRFTPGIGFRQLLAQIRDTTLGAFGHQELPFEKLVETLTPQRDMSRNPLFQVMFSLQNDVLAPPQMEGLSVTSPDHGIAKAKFDLTLYIREHKKGLRATFNFATDLFHAATIERMAGHYLTLLTAVAEDADQAITRLPILSEQELTQLAEWNDTDANFDSDCCVQHVFERQVVHAPKAIALSLNDKKLLTVSSTSAPTTCPII